MDTVCLCRLGTTGESRKARKRTRCSFWWPWPGPPESVYRPRFWGETEVQASLRAQTSFAFSSTQSHPRAIIGPLTSGDTSPSPAGHPSAPTEGEVSLGVPTHQQVGGSSWGKAARERSLVFPFFHASLSQISGYPKSAATPADSSSREHPNPADPTYLAPKVGLRCLNPLELSPQLLPGDG